MSIPPSSAVRALALEYKSLQEEPVEGFRVKLCNDDNLFEWEVAIFGPPDTLYQGGYFKVSWSASSQYFRVHSVYRFNARRCLANGVRVRRGIESIKNKHLADVLPHRQHVVFRTLQKIVKNVFKACEAKSPYDENATMVQGILGNNLHATYANLLK